MPEKIIPDRIEPVVAYRLWNIYISNPYMLKSHGWSGVEWPYQKVLKAFHDGYRDDGNILHRIDECPGGMTYSFMKCGIYGTKTFFSDKFNSRDFWYLLGQVYLWGLIIEHELGYRAEYAYPKCLYFDGEKDDIIGMIANNYKIPAIQPPTAEPPVTEIPNRFYGVPDAISRDTGVQR